MVPAWKTDSLSLGEDRLSICGIPSLPGFFPPDPFRFFLQIPLMRS